MKSVFSKTMVVALIGFTQSGCFGGKDLCYHPFDFYELTITSSNVSELPNATSIDPNDFEFEGDAVYQQLYIGRVDIIVGETSMDEPEFYQAEVVNESFRFTDPPRDWDGTVTFDPIQTSMKGENRVTKYRFVIDLHSGDLIIQHEGTVMFRIEPKVCTPGEL